MRFRQRIAASVCFIDIAGALLLAVVFRLPAVAQDASVRRSVTHSRRTRILKRTWHGMPASTPPRTEIVPLDPLPPGPAESPLLASSDDQSHESIDAQNQTASPEPTSAT